MMRTIWRNLVEILFPFISHDRREWRDEMEQQWQAARESLKRLRQRQNEREMAASLAKRRQHR